VLLALLLPQLGAAAVIGVLCCAALIGALHGLVHALAQVPSFVVTFAGLGLWSGIALAIAHASIPVEQGYQFVGWLDSHTLGLPHAFLFALAVLALLQFGVRRLPFGRYLYAIGNGERVALLSGVRVWRIKVATFATSAVCAALAGTVMVARTGSGNPSIADSLLLPSIAAVLVAGTAVTGGYGGLGRTLLGVLIVTVLRVGIAAAGIDPGYEPLAYGALVVVAASLTADRSKLGVVK
jgi:ribose transport system permease protein